MADGHIVVMLTHVPVAGVGSVFSHVHVTPPNTGPHQLTSGSRTRDSGAGGGRANKERQTLQPLASVTRASLFEVRGVMFTHSPYWHTSVTLR